MFDRFLSKFSRPLRMHAPAHGCPQCDFPKSSANFGFTTLARHTPLLRSHRDIPLALAETHTELLLVHPFREGNGRIARLLAKLMAGQVGIDIAGFDALVARQRKEYFAAVRAGLDRNYTPMRDLFSATIGGGAV